MSDANDAHIVYGLNNHGEPVVRGFHAVGPSGNLVLLRPDAPLKAGWRFATQDDLESSQLIAAASNGPDDPGHDARLQAATAQAAAAAKLKRRALAEQFQNEAAALMSYRPQPAVAAEVVNESIVERVEAAEQESSWVEPDMENETSEE